MRNMFCQIWYDDESTCDTRVAIKYIKSIRTRVCPCIDNGDKGNFSISFSRRRLCSVVGPIYLNQMTESIEDSKENIFLSSNVRAARRKKKKNKKENKKMGKWKE